jgi:hypothetical protein
VQTFLGGTSCTSATACTITGETHYPSGLVHTIAERWDGTAWHIQPTPNPAGASFASLGGVACTGPTSCLAVGGSDKGNLAERWNGTSWRIIPVPTPPGSQGLASISCAAPAACTAAGWAFTLQGGYLLAERWNGTSWTNQPTPLIAGDQDMNAADNCPTPTLCIAVGGQESPGPTAIPYAEQWTPGDHATSPTALLGSTLPPPTFETNRQLAVNPSMLRLGEPPTDIIQR